MGAAGLYQQLPAHGAPFASKSVYTKSKPQLPAQKQQPFQFGGIVQEEPMNASSKQFQNDYYMAGSDLGYPTENVHEFRKYSDSSNQSIQNGYNFDPSQPSQLNYNTKNVTNGSGSASQNDYQVLEDGVDAHNYMLDSFANFDTVENSF